MGPQVDNPESFGQFLRRERELREIKLEEIASYTRIKLRALQAIEQDDFASLPPLAFVRAFIRCYADYIGLSIPDVMLRFDGFVQSRYPELTGEVPVIKSPSEPSRHYVVIVLVLVVATLVVLAWWMSRAPIAAPKPEPPSAPGAGPILGTGGNLPPTADVINPTTGSRPGTTSTVPGTTATAGNTTGPDDGATLRPSPEAGITIGSGATPAAGTTARSAPQAGATATPAPTAGAAPVALPRVQVSEAAGATAAAAFGPPSTFAVPPGAKHQAVISVKSECWIGYTLDGVTKGELLLKPGQTVKLEGKDSVKLVIGNPNALSSFHHNGADVTFSPKCSPQHINFPAGPDDRECYPRPAPVRTAPPAPAGTRPPTTSPARPATTPSRPSTPSPGRPPASPNHP